MSATFSVRKIGQVTVIKIAGDLTYDVGSTQFRDTIRLENSGGSKMILLDLTGLSRFDASAYGELVNALTRITNQGGKIKLVICRTLADQFPVSKLNQIFEVFEDLTKAIASFDKPATVLSAGA